MDFGENRSLRALYGPEAFSRLDEGDDREFYGVDRLVPHVDSLALSTLEELAGELVVEARPAILDLMASWDSHLPAGLSPREVVGLGLNPRELGANASLTESVVHDLNEDPELPFEAGRFDVVQSHLSVDYMTRPFEVFAEVARVLRPGGLFLVTFSNRMFPTKAVRLWRESSEEERVYVVEDFFARASAFEAPTVFVAKGRPRPRDDKHAATGLPSDPVYAVYAERSGGGPSRRPRPRGPSELSRAAPARAPVVPAGGTDASETRRCPHCGSRLLRYRLPEGPFVEWDIEFFYVCFNDECPYLLRGWEVMASQGNVGFSYRLMQNPSSGAFGPLPVQSLSALRDGIED